MIISRKRYETEMARMLDRIEENGRAIDRLEDLHYKLKEYTSELERRIMEVEKNMKAEAARENNAIPIRCKDCRHYIETLDGYFVCEEDSLTHDPEWSCNEWTR